MALSRACVPRCKILLTLTLVCIPLGVIASVEKPNASIETQSLQTKITQRDFKIIEQLVSIAQRNSAIVQETKAAIGLSAYQDILFVELSPNQTTTSFAAPDTSSESARSFSLTITIDPIKLVGTISQMPIREARWNEAKHQKRLTVMQYYFAYLQACQASKIAAYRMQKFVQNSRVANLNSQAVSPHQVNYLANSEYVAATTEMLNANIREQLTLEELAVCVGLSPQKMITIINGQ
ncbi:MAG: hypothetical protein KME60_03910 [Cyanomargarita calcarea GSE-NOS-MK-12-04C]|uniref:Uncharacterized protein n=1 Tax=Cyanomargarita calcarea GSE-NOS-MK-12-04C TaxID=2839659 RepID=A0A951QKB4_9CYAN|nr:hypothetical protein [Cyanomargarita calcarea GSE-NOS-MK-12-04C]